MCGNLWLKFANQSNTNHMFYALSLSFLALIIAHELKKRTVQKDDALLLFSCYNSRPNHFSDHFISPNTSST
jgi:hypothetical protein